MGFGDTDLSSDVASGVIACSICLESVTGNGDRSMAKLQCGHEFHLDCIGSAFNAKGVMQCPNCRKIEKGNWLYANGFRSFQDLSTDEWTHDEDLYDLNYSEMPFGAHWCPFNSRLTRYPSSLQVGELSPPLVYHELSGHHAVFPEHPATSSVPHSCPFVPHFQPLQPSSPSNFRLSSESHVDGASYNRNWSSISRPSDTQIPHALPAGDLHYHGWEHHSPQYAPSISHTSSESTTTSAPMRAARLDSDDLQRAGSLSHPGTHEFGSGSRSVNGSFVSPMVPPSLGNSRVQALVHEQYQHRNSPGVRGSIFPGVRSSGPMRGLASIGSIPPPPSDHGGFYMFPPAGSSGPNLQENEDTGGNRLYQWERDRFAPYPLLPVERESSWWGPFPQAAGPSDSSSRMGFWHYGSEQSSSQGRSEAASYRPFHPIGMYSFI